MKTNFKPLKKILLVLGVSMVFLTLLFLVLTMPNEYEITPDPVVFNADPSNMKQRPFIVDKDEYPFRSNWYERNGVSMHYIDEGEGIPIVLCHGNPEWSFVYRNLIKELSGEARLIAYDLPGTGFTKLPEDWNYTPAEYSEWVESLIFDHLKLDKFIMVVQDWGGPTGLNVATNHPDNVISLVISNTWAWKIDSGGQKYGSYLWRSAMGQRWNNNRNFIASGFMGYELNETTASNQAVLDAYKNQFPTVESRIGTTIFPQNITLASEYLNTLEQKLPRLYDKEVEFIFGQRDIFLGTDDVIAKWRSHFPDANMTLIPEAGHFTQEDSPESYFVALRKLMSHIEQ